MKTLILDNYDSFTINLYQIVAEINGELPLVVRNDKVSWDMLKKLDFDNIIVSPGPGHPKNDKDFGVCRQVVLESEIPVLGVCLGHQGLAHWHGGTVRKSKEAMHGRISQVYHNGSRIFHNIPSPFSVVRYHSLSVENPLPSMLELTAWTADETIMGLQHQSKPLWGVQFHPESICTEYGMELLVNFRDMTQEFLRSRTSKEFFLLPPPEDISVVPSGCHKNGLSLYSSESKNTFPNCEIYFRKLDFFRNPEDVFSKMYSDSTRSFWLDSSLIEDGLSRFSFMGDDSGRHSFTISYKVSSEEIKVSEKQKEFTEKGDIFDFLQKQLEKRHCCTDHLPFDFSCGFVGYFGYELKEACGGESCHSSNLPDAIFMFVDQLIAFDHKENILYLVCMVEERSDAEAWFSDVEKQLHEVSSTPLVEPVKKEETVEFRLSREKETYLRDIYSCLDEISRGESYEICLTNLVKTDYIPDPFNFYRILRSHNPAPYSAFLRIGEISVACSSPERFLRIDKDGWVESKPIKGTLRRGNTEENDLFLKNMLRSNEKDRAENLMIVDLIRNDLGTVCEIGTVSVPKLMDIETYSTVHQMVSTVRGHLRPELHPVECIRQAFPGGSMTGAPKRRTMEIIDRLEQEARGVYSGSIGFLSLNGAIDLNIVIRTAVISPLGTTIGTGGAIVALSNPEDEFAEICLKARAIIESILLEAHGSIENSELQGFEDGIKGFSFSG